MLRIQIIAILLCCSNIVFSQSRWSGYPYTQQEKSHDVTVPAWGPYTKKYMGISHIADSVKGLRFDLSVMAGFYRQKVLVPNVLYESGYYPWHASADLQYFSFREELEWKDQVYTDIAFAPFDSRSRIIRIVCANKTAVAQNLVLHLVESLQYPEINPLQVSLPAYSKWISAIDYKMLSFANPRPQDNLTYDGWTKGEIRSADIVDGSGLGKGFGKNNGDRVEYELETESSLADAVLLIRYRLLNAAVGTFMLKGLYNDTVSFKASNTFTEARLRLGPIAKGKHNISLTAAGSAEIELDGFVMINQRDLDIVRYTTSFKPVPEIVHSTGTKQLVLKYEDVVQHYGVCWQLESSRIRQFHADAVDVALPLTVNNNGENIFTLNDKGHYTDIALQPIPLKPREEQVLYALVSSGTKDEVQASFAAFQEHKNLSALFKQYDAELLASSVNSGGNKYRFSQQIIKAVTLQNIVYPVYTSRRYIKHFTPGRWWNSLYTWDAGFIGLGMAGIDTAKAIQILNTYTTDAADSNAFIHHGSMVPVQAFLFQDLYNRTGSKTLLSYFYPRLQKYYLFYVGRKGSSTMRMPSNLIRSWDYFYNSGGWDDYPPQKFISGKKEYTDVVTPVINTSMAIRFAKILSTAATILGKKEDVNLYDEDIRLMSTALQQFSWDEPSGYFGYVLHDKAGKPSGLLRTNEGVNYNLGMDGMYPLVAGITTRKQQQTVIKALFSPKKIWSPVGLSAVDQSAPYYTNEGYWNGTVWFPHQWIFWKTMLDLGEGDRAFQIATTALEVWKKEVELSYHSTEHFSIETGRGAGWHQFSALSTPVMMWYNAYYQPGNITTGFNGWIESSHFSADHTALNAVIHFSTADHTPVILVCMKEGRNYTVTINKVKVTFKQTVKGLIQIRIPASINGRINLQITPG